MRDDRGRLRGVFGSAGVSSIRTHLSPGELRKTVLTMCIFMLLDDDCTINNINCYFQKIKSITGMMFSFHYTYTYIINVV